MAGKTWRWEIRDLVDLEQALTSTRPVPGEVKVAVAEAARGLEGAEARRVGIRVWLDHLRNGGRTGGRGFTSGLSLAAGMLGSLAACAGASAVIGMLEPARGGVNVTLFLAVLLGGQWLILAIALAAWLFRRRAGEGFSALQALAGKFARRLAGETDGTWWRNIMDGGGQARAAMLWRLARLAQGAGICFNLGIIGGLAGLVLLKNVGFFWETTTEDAMRAGLGNATAFLASPWAAWWPEAIPDAATIDATRWLPGRPGILPPGPSAWWLFLLMATLVWGLLPRAVLWFLAWRSGRVALAKLDFQGRHHRALWRELTGIDRAGNDEKPLDGVLVLDVGGSGLAEASLRPFLLRRLRVHPAAWQSTAVLDPGAETEASRALALAPAGVVLLAEGWALSPPRMRDLHARIRAAAGPDTPVKFLAANVGPAGNPAPPNDVEIREWERFVDSLRDPAAEVYFFAES